MIYRKFSCDLTKKNSANLLRNLAICNTGIKNFYTLANNLPPKTVGTWTGFFLLVFPDQARLDKFEKLMNMKTISIETVNLN